RHCLDERHAEALVLTQRHIGAGGPVPAKELRVGDGASESDVPLKARSTDHIVELRLIGAGIITVADQYQTQWRAPARANLINESDKLRRPLVRHDPTEKQYPSHHRLIEIRLLRMRRFSDPREIFEKWDYRHIVKAAAGQLPRIKRRHRHRRFDDIAKLSEL